VKAIGPCVSQSVRAEAESVWEEGEEMRNRRLGPRLSVTAIVLTLAIGAGAKMVAAQDYGALKGRVQDINNNILPGATVHIEPGAIAIVTDREGYFNVAKLSPGTYKVEVSYLGFGTDTKEVQIKVGDLARVDFKLAPAKVSEDITVTASRSRGETEALEERKNSINIVNVLPSEVIQSLPNANLADAIGRLPSVSLERDEGEGKYVQVRGLEPQFTNVTINGVHVPSVSAGNENYGRQIKLDAFPSDLVGTLELRKTLSADQDGDAIGGSVNIINRVPGDQEYFSIGGLGGYNAQQGGRYNYNFDATYLNRFGPNKELGLSLSGTYDWNGRSINDVEPTVAVVSLPNGDSLSTHTGADYRNYRYDRSRYGVAGGLDYRLGLDSVLFLKGWFSQFRNFGDRWVTTATVGNFLTPTLTDNTGSFSANVQNRRPNEQTYSVAGGGNHKIGSALLDYTISYSHAQLLREDQLQADFNGASAAFQVDDSRKFFPKFNPLGGVDQLDATQYVLSDYRIDNETSRAHDATIAANMTFPYMLGNAVSEIKFGGKYRDEKKTVTTNDRIFNVTGGPVFHMSDGLDNFSDPNYYMGEYLSGPFASLDAVTKFFNANPGAFTEDVNGGHINNDPNNFSAKEKIAAAYIKDSNRFGALQFEIGVRMEHTDASYTGNQINLDPDGNWLSTTPTSGDSTYTDWLPSVSFRYETDPNTNLRFVYAWAVGRPNYGLLAPSLTRSDTNKELDAGNPNLKPTKAQNYDLLFEHFFGSVGVVSAGGFYKNLDDPIYPGSATTIVGGPFDGYKKVQPVNGPNAKIWGFEIGWQQRLRFLPGFLNGFGIDANYTYTDSKATFDPTTGRSGTARLQRTTPNAANVGVTYDTGPFSARIAATYNSATIFTYNYVDGAPGGLNGPNGDIYLYPHTQLDAQASYALKNGLQVIFSVLNINNEVFGFYQGDPHFNIQREFYQTTYNLGFRMGL
jgi:TonB-dependent receptor